MNITALRKSVDYAVRELAAQSGLSPVQADRDVAFVDPTRDGFVFQVRDGRRGIEGFVAVDSATTAARLVDAVAKEIDRIRAECAARPRP